MKRYTKLIYITLAMITVCNSCLLVKDTSVNSDKFLKGQTFGNSVYGASPRDFILSPFEMRIETSERIINFDFKGHDRYVFLECQVYDDTIFGQGVVAMLTDKNDKFEIYHTKGLNMKQKHYYLDSNQGRIPMFVFDPQCSFTNENDTINFTLKFHDNYGNSIEASLNGYYPDNINFIAPMGLMGSGKPKFAAFPIFYMREVNFMSINEGKASVAINNNPMNIVKIPGYLNWKRIKLARWSFDPVFILWNWNRKDTISEILKSDVIKNESGIKVAVSNGYAEIKSIQFKAGKHSSIMNFAPALPELLCLKNGISLEGRFTIDVDEKKGVVGGIYSVMRNSDVVELTIHPIKCWQPIPGPSWAKKHHLVIRLIENSSNNVEIISEWMVR